MYVTEDGVHQRSRQVCLRLQQQQQQRLSYSSRSSSGTTRYPCTSSSLQLVCWFTRTEAPAELFLADHCWRSSVWPACRPMSERRPKRQQEPTTWSNEADDHSTATTCGSLISYSWDDSSFIHQWMRSFTKCTIPYIRALHALFLTASSATARQVISEFSVYFIHEVYTTCRSDILALVAVKTNNRLFN